MESSSARVGDIHVCPQHGGGQILPLGCPTVLIGGQFAARVRDLALCGGTTLDAILKGSITVFIGNEMAARLGDTTVHGGLISQGLSTVLIGGKSTRGILVPGMSSYDAMMAILQAQSDLRDMLEAKKAELAAWDDAAKANFELWFGTTDDKVRKVVQARLDKMLEFNAKLTLDYFQKAVTEKDTRFAYVYRADPDHTMYLDNKFASAPATGEDSRAGSLGHEMSHFEDIGDTHDHVYNTTNAKQLAKDSPEKALSNADNLEYYLEGVR